MDTPENILLHKRIKNLKKRNHSLRKRVQMDRIDRVLKKVQELELKLKKLSEKFDRLNRQHMVIGYRSDMVTDSSPTLELGGDIMWIGPDGKKYGRYGAGDFDDYDYVPDNKVDTSGIPDDENSNPALDERCVRGNDDMAGMDK